MRILKLVVISPKFGYRSYLYIFSQILAYMSDPTIQSTIDYLQSSRNNNILVLVAQVAKPRPELTLVFQSPSVDITE